MVNVNKLSAEMQKELAFTKEELAELDPPAFMADIFYGTICQIFFRQTVSCHFTDNFLSSFQFFPCQDFRLLPFLFVPLLLALLS